MTTIAKTLKLSDSMRHVLASATLLPDGRVVAHASHGRTRDALIRRGATQDLLSASTVELDLALTIAAVECFDAASRCRVAQRLVMRDLNNGGFVTSGGWHGQDPELWAMVREGSLRAELGAVQTMLYNRWRRGWIFRPVHPTQTQQDAWDAYLSAWENAPEWQRGPRAAAMAS